MRIVFLSMLMILSSFVFDFSDAFYVLKHYNIPLRCRNNNNSIIRYANKVSDEMNWDPNAAPKLNFEEDYYSILEVSPTIDQKALKKAYYKMVFKYHPDNKEGDAAKSLCNKQMMVINAAYKVLKDEELRMTYDRKRQMGFRGANANVKSTTSSSSSSSSSNSNSYKQSSTSSSSSSNSYSNADTNNNARSAYKIDDNESTESFADILSDLWSDMRKNGGNNILDDMVSFLEEQLDASNIDTSNINDVINNAIKNDPYSTRSSSSSSKRSVKELETAIISMKSAIENTQNHLKHLMKLYDTEKALISNDSNMRDVRAGTDIGQMQDRFRKIESLQGLKARIAEVEKQIKQLKRQLLLLYEEQKEASSRNSNSGSSNSTRSSCSTYNSVPNPNSYDTYTSKSSSSFTNKNIIDKEMELLKKKMGIK